MERIERIEKKVKRGKKKQVKEKGVILPEEKKIISLDELEKKGIENKLREEVKLKESKLKEEVKIELKEESKLEEKKLKEERKEPKKSPISKETEILTSTSSTSSSTTKPTIAMTPFKKERTPEETINQFLKIVRFVNDLYGSFGEGRKGLALYNTLLSKIKVIHIGSMNMHIDIFHNYCENNKELIKTKNSDGLRKIVYKPTICIDLPDILRKARPDERTIIWKYLLLILYESNPAEDIKSIIAKDDSKESEFLNDIVSKLEESGIQNMESSDPA